MSPDDYDSITNADFLNEELNPQLYAACVPLDDGTFSLKTSFIHEVVDKPLSICPIK
jgi:hypothetical protein